MSRLHIRFKKGATPILECIRQDGTRTWQKSQLGMVPHDLAHYVVESQLGFTKGFYGLLADGWDIEDFEKPRSERPQQLLPKNLSVEAIYTEHLVNMLLVSLQSQGALEFHFTTFQQIVKDHQLAASKSLTFNQFKDLHQKLKELLNAYKIVVPPDHLELKF
jgi:hypothetical protein